MKTDLFQSCGHCWVFQICWHIECKTFTASFRIWNNLTGIPLPPLALFIVMLPKAHLTSHSRMSGSSWVITPSWLSGSWRSFLYSFSVYSCHLFLIASASVGPYHFCPLLCPSLHEMKWNELPKGPIQEETSAEGEVLTSGSPTHWQCLLSSFVQGLGAVLLWSCRSGTGKHFMLHSPGRGESSSRD